MPQHHTWKTPQTTKLLIDTSVNRKRLRLGALYLKKKGKNHQKMQKVQSITDPRSVTRLSRPG